LFIYLTESGHAATEIISSGAVAIAKQVVLSLPTLTDSKQTACCHRACRCSFNGSGWYDYCHYSSWRCYNQSSSRCNYQSRCVTVLLGSTKLHNKTYLDQRGSGAPYQNVR